MNYSYNWNDDAVMRLRDDYPQEHNVEWIYASNWYDGPIDGIVEIDTRRYWARMVSESENGSRTYELIYLDAEMWAYVDEMKADFERWVGTHWSFNTPDGEVKPLSNHHKFYDKYPPGQTDPIYGTTIGWFES